MSDAAFPSRPPRWRLEIPDLSGRRAVVTGASDGIGVEIARGLALGGAEVVMPVRSKAKGVRAVEALRAADPGALLTLRSLDLASLASVSALTRQLLAEGEPIDLLVLNAGIVRLKDPVRHLTADGFELHLQTNMLAHALLVAGLLPLLRARGSRVVLQCSLAARFGRIAWDDPAFDHGYRPLRAYAMSKTALGLFGTELARRSDAGQWGVRAVLCHPGTAATNIAPAELYEGPGVSSRVNAAIARSRFAPQSAAEASLPALFAATSPDAGNGHFIVPSGRMQVQGPPVRGRLYRSLDRPAEAARVWELVEQTTGARFPPATRDAGRTNPDSRGGGTITAVPAA